MFQRNDSNRSPHQLQPTPTSQIAITKQREEEETIDNEDFEKRTDVKETSSLQDTSEKAVKQDTLDETGFVTNTSGSGSSSENRKQGEDQEAVQVSKEDVSMKTTRANSPSSRSPSPDDQTLPVSKSEQELSEKSEQHREELIEQYYQIQKDRRELRRRNLQAQTNIAQYFRKHKLNPYPAIPNKGQDFVRQEYLRLLQEIEDLANQKEAEMKSFETESAEIAEEQSILSSEIARLKQEMVEMRLRAAKESVHRTSGKTLLPKDVHDHVKELDQLSDQTKPIRLKYVKLCRILDDVKDKWFALVNDQNKGIDSVEIILENQILSEKAEQRRDELASLEKKIEEDVIVLSHNRMKCEQMIATNEELDRQLNNVLLLREEKRIKLTDLKSKQKSLRQQREDLLEQLGLLKSKELLKDYMKTYVKLANNNFSDDQRIKH